MTLIAHCMPLLQQSIDIFRPPATAANLQQWAHAET